ncbi:hypothetical protein LPB72_14830 [Hydrogenophaga crassostreae]|uniref:Uncharacterized protein n=1 Tax=Hydrogenophaga crassostreae TaxID=1763535 RepID=A0A162VXH1_9BURK|nr:hypothetical protein [Hydrogenophaga crassostreae]AOW12235.1 hypothetical protein LPB072_04580 [Hydrogenophaga crassostreae]OAD41181.1 hypothetical protein LPB72_14830 [Hydrogenophaga crassostreae]
MFEFGVDQAAGLRTTSPTNPPVLMPVATTARPGQAYELICTVASQLNAMGHDAVIIDGSAIEAVERRSHDGSHLGLIHALLDSSIGSLGAPLPSAEWLVMPGAKGLQVLQQTARAAGATVAVSRLLAPFAAGTVVLLYAPAPTISALFAGLQAQVLVPVLDLPQATIDAYGSLKTLHGAGLWPVLAPMHCQAEATQAPLAQVVRSVCDCAHRYLHYPVEQWAVDTLGQRVREAAFTVPGPSGASLAVQTGAMNNFAGHAAAIPTRWS